jgi:hypothetical protein
VRKFNKYVASGPSRTTGTTRTSNSAFAASPTIGGISPVTCSALITGTICAITAPSSFLSRVTGRADTAGTALSALPAMSVKDIAHLIRRRDPEHNYSSPPARVTDFTHTRVILADRTIISLEAKHPALRTSSARTPAVKARTTRRSGDSRTDTIVTRIAYSSGLSVAIHSQLRTDLF